jgi:hypothetical protein
MGIWDIIGAAWREATKPEAQRKGEKFENYVLRVFHPVFWELKHQTQKIGESEGHYVTSSLRPDFTFKHRFDTIHPYINIEAKYRSSFTRDERVEVCKPYQLERYREFDKHCDTYILLGFGGSAVDPEFLFLIPVHEMKYPALFPSVLQKYQIPPRCILTLKQGKPWWLNQKDSEVLWDPYTPQQEVMTVISKYLPKQ